MKILLVALNLITLCFVIFLSYVVFFNYKANIVSHEGIESLFRIDKQALEALVEVQQRCNKRDRENKQSFEIIAKYLIEQKK